MYGVLVCSMGTGQRVEEKWASICASAETAALLFLPCLLSLVGASWPVTHPYWPQSILLFCCAPPLNRERHRSLKLTSGGCLCREMVNSSNEAEEQSPGTSIAEGLVLCKTLTNDWGNNKQPISSLVLLMWQVVLNTT